MGAVSEATIQAAIIARLRGQGVYAVKHHSAGRGRKGVPDILACVEGAAVYIECKQPERGTLTEDQRREADHIIRAGGIFAVLDDKTQVDQLLLNLRAHTKTVGYWINLTGKTRHDWKPAAVVAL